jgi:RluA family pseudouridine synthase
MEVRIITETSDYYVINKPAGLACEPPSTTPTLRDWLIEHGHIQAGEWGPADRFGIVHRLDTDTSGVMVWAKTPLAQERLRQLWQGRATQKTYLGLVSGVAEPSGEIELAIMRDNKNDRQTVALLPDKKARPAITRYRRIAVGEIGSNKVSLVEAHPITGRTHQIRVHMKSALHPIVGDKLYGDKSTQATAKDLGLSRHWLHAAELSFEGHTYKCALPIELSQSLKMVGIEFEQQV